MLVVLASVVSQKEANYLNEFEPYLFENFFDHYPYRCLVVTLHSANNHK
jgi:hypothetical protein